MNIKEMDGKQWEKRIRYDQQMFKEKQNNKQHKTGSETGCCCSTDGAQLIMNSWISENN